MVPSRKSTLYGRLLAVLERYISRGTMQAMLKTVFEERGIDPERMTAEDLVAVVEEVMIGLRLFCSPSRLPDLMLELAELCDTEAAADDALPQRPTPSRAVEGPANAESRPRLKTTR